MSELVLNAENIKKSFVTGEVTAEVLKGVDFSLSEGEFVAVLPPVPQEKSDYAVPTFVCLALFEAACCQENTRHPHAMQSNNRSESPAFKLCWLI